ncbi:MAG: putative transporter [Deltaproteobacteria bacterium]|nr:putative transporter [Deltaproteobacteria bacterium]
MGLRRLLIADAVSSFGDWLTYVGISVLAIGQRHDELALAVVLIAHTLPRVACAPLAGALADRVDRRTMLVAASAARGIAALAMVAAAISGSAWAVQVLHLARMALGAFTDAAARAALPRLVPSSRLARANALLGASWSATFVLGIVAGGIVTATWGVAAAFAADAVTFLIAAAAFARLPPIPAERTQRPRRRPGLSAPVRRAALAKVPISIATGAAWILLNLASGRQAEPATAAFAIGAIHVARATGNGIAAVAWPRRWRASWQGIHVATAVGLVGVAAFSASGALAWAVVWGIGVGANWMAATTVLQATSPDAVLGQAVAHDVVAQAIAQCAGGVIAVMVAGLAGSSAVISAAGVAVASLAWAWIARRVT